MGVNVYISCHVHVKAARSGRAALELLAVRKGWGYTNNEQYTCPSTEKNRKTLTLTCLTNPKLQLLSHAIHSFVCLFVSLQSKYSFFLFFPSFLWKKIVKNLKNGRNVTSGCGTASPTNLWVSEQVQTSRTFLPSFECCFHCDLGELSAESKTHKLVAVKEFQSPKS